MDDQSINTQQVPLGIFITAYAYYCFYIYIQESI